MSAPSDGARADARKRLAAATSTEALADALGDIRVAGARQADWWTNDTEHSLLIQVLRGECVPWAEGLLASDWLAGVITDAKAEAWDERDRARATYPDPHPEDCMGWEDCDCASYPNPYRGVQS